MNGLDLGRRCALAFACILSLAGSASGQVLNGEVFAKVTDQTDAVLPGATVTLSGPALIAPMTVVAAESGAYRLPNVPIGTYSVSVELAGFSKVVREGIIVQAGRNVEINVKLTLSTLAETVTITGASPVVDIKSTSLGVNFGKELLEAIPTARDPWVVIEQTPGLVMAVNNVGGRNSGQMDGYNAFGSGSNKQWSMDGATVTDMASNSAPTYYDVEMFEEIQIMTGGMDASRQQSAEEQHQGTTHYPVHKQLDVNLDKTMAFGKRRVTLSATGFNLLNASTGLGRETRQDFARANYVTSILAPRVFRVGAKVAF